MIQSNPSKQTQKMLTTGICISELIFDDGNYVTLAVKCRVENKLQQNNLVMPFAVLNDLLRFSGTIGEQVLLKMLDVMMLAKKAPYIVNCQSDFGKEIIITTCSLQLQNMASVDNIKNTNCYYVPEIIPINLIQQAKNLQQHVYDFKTNSVDCGSNKNEETLYNMYAYYKGLLDLDINEPSARSKAKLEDNRIFTLAQKVYLHKK